MTHTHAMRLSGALDPHLQFAEIAFRSGQLAERLQREVRKSQRSAAESFAKSADSHDRTAKSYEKLAELGEVDEYLEHAACHRAFAQEDRRIAERLRRMAGD
jgi:hypothetical protein